MSTIELAAPRVIAIGDRGMQFKLKLSRITKRQWLKYFEAIVSTSENQGGKRVDHFDSSAARVELVESAMVDAEGYATADGSPVASLSGWQQLVPAAHRLAAGEVLVSVERGTFPEGGSLVLGANPIYLNAVWSIDESGLKMVKYYGLCHLFKTPTAEQQRRLGRDSSRSVIIGGSRRGTTRWMGAQATLAELYDELIISVDGYTINGSPLGDRDAIAAEMDTFHKVAAVDLLFAPAQVNLGDEAE